MAVRAGYKQTEVGVIPEEWGESELGSLTVKVGSGITPTGGAKIYRSSGRPFIRSQNIGEGTLLLDDIAFIDEATHETFKSTEIEEGDVFLNITGASIGRSAVADRRVAHGNVNQHVCIIRPQKRKLSPQFLNYILLSALGQSQVDSFQAGGNRQGLNFGQIRTFRLPLPPLSEQEAIAEALSDADALITGLDQLIAKKRDIKQAAMQQLLTGKTRLPGFSGEWPKERLGELGNTYGGLSGKTKGDFGKGSSRYIPFLNVINNVVIDPGALEHVRVGTSENQNDVRRGDLFFNGSSETPEEVGMSAVLMDDLQDTYLNSFCFGFRLSNGIEADGLFLAYYFRSGEGRKLLYSLAQGATRYNLSKANFLKLEVPLPDLGEQTAIATVLSDMDAEIAALEAERNKTRLVKQGMMQELLTGRVRLVDPSAAETAAC